MPSQWTIVGLGEVLWDVFPDGRRFGGAPANFACSSAGIVGSAGQVSMLSRVGADALGDEALRILQEKHVDTTCVGRTEKPTGRVDVTLDESGKAEYTFAADSAWDHLQMNAAAEALAARTDAVCFGTLGQRSPLSRAAIATFLDLIPEAGLKVFDINLRPPFYDEAVIERSLEAANVLKLNDEELPLLEQQFGLEGSATDVLRRLAERFELRCVALTRGDEGAILVRGDEVSQRPGVPTKVIDTVGAGDAFTSCLTAGLLAKRSLDAINDHATRVAAFVCSQAGATPTIPLELQLAGE